MFSAEIIKLVNRFKHKSPSSNFKRWEPELYYKLVQETNFLPEGAMVVQRLWHIDSNTSEIPKCTVCGGEVCWDKQKHQYRRFCSLRKCAGQSQDIKDKRLQTMNTLYGVDHYTQHSEFNGKRQKTYRNNYNVDWSLQSQEIRNKIMTTTFEKYGTKVYTQSEDYKIKNKQSLKELGLMSSSQKRISPESLLKLNCSNWLIEQHHINQKTITAISNELGVDGTTVVNRLNQFGIEIKRFSTSQGHREIVQYIQTIYSGVIKINERGILHSKKELDIYLPEFNLAIEYCGLYWHSPDIHNRMYINYHKDKLQECHNQGINLLTIFEDEWIEKQQIIQSIIKNKIKLCDVKVPARKTVIKELSARVSESFLNQYHIQGNGPGSIKIGVFSDDKLVAVCKVIKHKNNTLTLNRYATCCVVQGGFSKILKYIKSTYNPASIITFADLRFGVGDLYNFTQFIKIKTIPPDYMYVNNNKRCHKFNYRHARLKRMLSSYDITKTEVANCLDHGLFRVWDCGKIKFELFVN